MQLLREQHDALAEKVDRHDRMIDAITHVLMGGPQKDPKSIELDRLRAIDAEIPQVQG